MPEGVTEHWGEPPKDIDNPQWKPLLGDPDGILVTWKDKYGENQSAECIAIWFSKETQSYMLTWKDSKKTILEKSNTNFLTYRKKS